MTLQDDILNIAKEYMGPAAEKFIKRRCEMMRLDGLNDLKKEHLEFLAITVQATAKVYLDEERVLKFKEDILALK